MISSLYYWLYKYRCERPWKQLRTAPLTFLLLFVYVASSPKRYWEHGACVARSKDLLSSGRHNTESYRHHVKSRHSGLIATSYKSSILHEHLQPLVKTAWPQMGRSSWLWHVYMDLCHTSAMHADLASHHTVPPALHPQPCRHQFSMCFSQVAHRAPTVVGYSNTQDEGPSGNSL